MLPTYTSRSRSVPQKGHDYYRRHGNRAQNRDRPFGSGPRCETATSRSPSIGGARREKIDGKEFIIVHALEWLDDDEMKTADVIVCGHTHEPLVERGRPMVINPGECGGWVSGRCTIAVLDTETLEAEVIEVGTA